MRPSDPELGTHTRLEPTENPPTHTGQLLGKYLLGARLGEGGMGVVYEAEDTLLKRKVAVKLLRKGYLASDKAVQRFLREARAAARLNHAHVVTIYEVDRAGDTYYLVMERMEGGSAQDLLVHSGTVPWQRATRL